MTKIENFPFALYASNDDRTFWKKFSLVSKKSILSKNFIKTKYAIYYLLSTIKFGSSMQLTCLIFSIKIGEILSREIKFHKTKVAKRLDQIKTKNLFSMTILVKMFETK